MKKIALILIVHLSSIITTKAQTCPAVSLAFEPNTIATAGKLDPYCLTTDDYSNIYIAGSFGGGTVSFNNGVPSINSSSGGGYFVAKYDKFGNAQWAINMGNVATLRYLTGIAVSPDGSKIYVTGIYQGTAIFGSHSLTSLFNNAGTTRSYDVFVAKLEDDGGTRNWAWAVSGGGKGFDIVRGIDIDNYGKVYIGGQLDATTSGNEGIVFGSITESCLYNDDSFVARLSDNGTSATWDWLRKASADVSCTASIITYTDDLFAIKCNKATGDVFVTGYYYQDGGASGHTFSFGGFSIPKSNSNDNEAYILKLNTNGTGQWITKAGGTTIGNQEGRGIAVDSVGNVFLIGEFRNTVNFGLNTNEIPSITSVGSSDVFIGKINANGTWAWAKGMGGNNIEAAGGIDYQNGQIWGVGTFRATASFKIANQLTALGTTISPASYPDDIFLVNLDKNGNWLGDGVTQMGGNDVDRMYFTTNSGYSMGFDVDKNNVPHAAGRYTGTAAIFGNTTLTRSGENPFVVRVNCGETPANVCFTGMSAFQPAVVTPTANTNANFQITSMLKDASGNSFLAGGLSGEVTFSMVSGGTSTYLPANGGAIIVKLNASNQALWVYQFGNSQTLIYDIAFGDEGILITGNFSNTATFRVFNTWGFGAFANFNVTSNGLSDIFVGELAETYDENHTPNLERQFKWLKTAGGTGNDYSTGVSQGVFERCVITGVLGASSGAVSFGSHSISQPLSNTLFVASVLDYYDFEEQGFLTIWNFAKAPTQPSGAVNAESLGWDIVMNGDGDAYISGTYKFNSTNTSQAPSFGSTLMPTTNNGYSMLVAKIDINGNWLWSSRAGNNATAGHVHLGSNIILGETGFVYVSGSITLPSSDILKFGNGTTSDILPFNSTNNTKDGFIGKISESGTWIWAKQFGNSQYETAAGVVYKNGILYLTGGFNEQISILGNTISTVGMWDYFFVQLTQLGQWLPHTLQRGGGPENDHSVLIVSEIEKYPIAIDNDNNVYTAGAYQNSATFGTSTLSNSFNGAASNAVVIKASCTTCTPNPIVLSNPAQNIPTFSPTQKTASSITATNHVLNGNVLYQAGSFIELNPGFKVEAGTVFKAQLGGCN
jgi:hypothetical protein